jgi:metallo-beta-lactamase class B
MKLSTWIALGICALSPVAQDKSALRPDPPIVCSGCDAWNARKEPRRVFGNTYSVGTAGLGSVLITSAKGHILLDGGLPQTAPLIDRNIRQLGFRTEDIRLIVNSHAHYDHAGGIAAIQRLSGATVAASASGARAIEQGEPSADDPQYAFGATVNRFPTVKSVRVVADAEVLRVGELSITAHLTPGHTTGSTTWSWRSCDNTECRNIVYADSLNPVSAPAFRFTGDATHPSRVDEFRHSIRKVGGLPCDIVLAVHPVFAEGKTCRTYADDAMQRLEQRIKEEK